jgi:hypothetical protein
MHYVRYFHSSDVYLHEGDDTDSKLSGVCIYAGKGAESPQKGVTTHDVSGIISSVRRNLRDDPVPEEGEDEQENAGDSKTAEEPESATKRSKRSIAQESPSRLAFSALNIICMLQAF